MVTNAATPGGETLRGLLDRPERLREGGRALIDARSTGLRDVSYTELQQLTASAAARLVAAGVSHGDVVGMWMANSTEALAVQFAAASLGAAVVGMNTRYRISELAHLLGRTLPACVVLPSELLNIDFRGLLAVAIDQVVAMGGSMEPPAILVAGDDIGDVAAYDVGGGAAALDLTREKMEFPNVGEASDVVNMFSTSGSTGMPKFATHDQASVARHARNVAQRLGVGTGDVLLCALPLCGVFGFNFAMAGLAAGATCLLVPTFEGRAVLQLMAECGVTHTCGGDDLYERLIDASEGSAATPTRWRRGAIADFTGRASEVVEWADTKFGARLCGVYGSSECFALTAIRDVRSDVVERSRGGGDVVDGEIEVRAVDADSGAVLGPDEAGELQVRGYNVMRGYYSDHSATARAFTEDGWLRTGDLGAVEKGGRRFAYHCRVGDALRLHGFLVEPAEIEAFLVRHPAVDSAHVVGAPGDDGVEEAVAFVTIRSPVEEIELLEECRKWLARYKVPRRIVKVDKFPMTSGTNGAKVVKGELREWAMDILREQ